MVLLIWLHMFAAVSWIGGTIFLSVVLMPVLRHEPFASQRAVLIRTTALRFRVVVWGAIAVLLLTGPPLLHQRGIPIADPAGWPMVLSVKLGLVSGGYYRSPRRAEPAPITPWSHGLPGSLAAR
jgi:copper resistance protein D